MISEIIFGSDGWEIIIRNLWNRSKAVNNDFKGVSNEKEFIESVLGKEIYKKKYATSDVKRVSHTTRAEVFILTDEKRWSYSKLSLSYSFLIKIIERTMKENDEILVFIGAERDESLRDREKPLETITVKKIK